MGWPIGHAFLVRRPKDTAKMEIVRHHKSSGSQNCTDLFPTAWWENRVVSSEIPCCGRAAAGNCFQHIAFGGVVVICSVGSACEAGNIPQMA